MLVIRTSGTAGTAHHPADRMDPQPRPALQRRDHHRTNPLRLTPHSSRPSTRPWPARCGSSFAEAAATPEDSISSSVTRAVRGRSSYAACRHDVGQTLAMRPRWPWSRGPKRSVARGVAVFGSQGLADEADALASLHHRYAYGKRLRAGLRNAVGPQRMRCTPRGPLFSRRGTARRGPPPSGRPAPSPDPRSGRQAAPRCRCRRRPHRPAHRGPRVRAAPRRPSGGMPPR
jgi:hypothetical protein